MDLLLSFVTCQELKFYSKIIENRKSNVGMLMANYVYIAAFSWLDPFDIHTHNKPTLNISLGKQQ